MTIFILLAFIAIFPILAYLLANQTTNKGIIFGLSLIVISLCLIIFISKFSVIGSFKKQVLNNEILEEIYIDSKISKNAFEGIESLLQADEIQVWLISFIGKAIELNKLNSAESLVTYAEKFFTSNEEKLIFYNLYTNLRDAKFPLFANANLSIEKDSEFPCTEFSGSIKLFILNGPEIPIAEKLFKQSEEIFVSNKDSLIPGFDLSSAYLNDETIESVIAINCKDTSLNFLSKDLIVLEKNQPSLNYKIELNEWLKESQEL